MVLGAVVALALRPSLAISIPLIGAFALLHGYSHGVELPATASVLELWRGLHRGNAGAARRWVLPPGLIDGPPAGCFAARTTGGAIAVLGVVLLVTLWRPRAPISPAVALPGKISDLITTGTAPELSSIVPMSM